MARNPPRFRVRKITAEFTQDSFRWLYTIELSGSKACPGYLEHSRALFEMEEQTLPSECSSRTNRVFRVHGLPLWDPLAGSFTKFLS